MSSSFTIETTKQAVDSYMLSIFSLRTAEAQHVGSRYADLWRNIETVTMAGGKRLRPYLTVVGYGTLDDTIIPIATAQEFVHIAMLMHDDVIDQDFVRHSHQNINGHYRDKYAQNLEEPRATHYANSAGILAGDAVLSEAYRIVASSDIDPDKKAMVSDVVGTSVFEVIGGELLDVEAAFVRDVVYDPIKIYRYKTASYSFVGPLLAGAYCRGSDQQTIKTLTQFATNLGIAFQIQDDLLGVFGNEAVTGKSTVTDLVEGKRTLLVLHHEQAMNDEMRARFEAFGSAKATAEQLEAIKFDMIQSGARDKTIEAIELYFSNAAQHLAKLNDKEQRARLEELMNILSKRRV